MKKQASSYLDEIGSGYDAKNVDGPQVGLDHEQEVASSNNWEDDKRDAIGRAASISSKKKRLATKLMRISRELEALGKMEEEYQAGIEEMLDDDYDDELDAIEPTATKKTKEKYPADEKDPMSVEMGTDDWLDPAGKEASHPIEHNPAGDDAKANADSAMGDEWIDIGPGNFSDKRDSIGKAAD